MEQGQKYLKYKGKIVFGRQSMPYFDRVLKEYTENEACFVFVNEGEFKVRAQEESFNLDSKSGILAKCLNYFFESDKKHRSSSERVDVMAVLLHPSIVEELFDFELSKTNHQLGFNIKKVALDSLLENFKSSINILLDNPELADDEIIKNKLKEFVLIITKFQGISSAQELLGGLFSPSKFSFKSAIRKNLYSNLSIVELAKLCHLSTSSFKRKFHENFGESPKKYINSRKIERAANMLRSAELRISDIAYEVGFDSLATFNRNFNRSFGKSPSEYRSDLIEESLN